MKADLWISPVVLDVIVGRPIYVRVRLQARLKHSLCAPETELKEESEQMARIASQQEKRCLPGL